jgi:hypothetical protein
MCNEWSRLSCCVLTHGSTVCVCVCVCARMFVCLCVSERECVCDGRFAVPTFFTTVPPVREGGECLPWREGDTLGRAQTLFECGIYPTTRHDFDMFKEYWAYVFHDQNLSPRSAAERYVREPRLDRKGGSDRTPECTGYESRT